MQCRSLTLTSPVCSSLCMASVGHTRTHTGSSQWLHATDTLYEKQVEPKVPSPLRTVSPPVYSNTRR